MGPGRDTMWGRRDAYGAGLTASGPFSEPGQPLALPAPVWRTRAGQRLRKAALLMIGTFMSAVENAVYAASSHRSGDTLTELNDRTALRNFSQKIETAPSSPSACRIVICCVGFGARRCLRLSLECSTHQPPMHIQTMPRSLGWSVALSASDAGDSWFGTFMHLYQPAERLTHSAHFPRNGPQPSGTSSSAQCRFA